MRRRFTALLATLALAAVAHADDVVLTTGRTLTGRITKETDAEIVLEMNAGAVTFSRSLIREIRRGPVPVATSPARPTPSTSKPAAAPKADAAPTKAPGPPTGSDLLAQLQKIELRPWETEVPVRVTETHAGKFKALPTNGGTAQMLSALPATPDGIAKLYCHSTIVSDDSPARDGATFHWLRVYWDEELGRWSATSPAAKPFERASELARQIVDLCCTDEGGKSLCRADERELAECIARTATDTLRYGASSTTRARERICSALRTHAVASAGPAAGAALAHYHEAEAQIAAADKPEEKIRRAGERRTALNDLVNLTGK